MARMTTPDDPTPAAARSAALPIYTDRLDLLPLHVEHAAEMAEVLADPSLHAFIGGAPDTAEALRRRYERMTAGAPDPDVSWLNWVIRLRAEACLTGTVQATVSPADEDGDRNRDGHWDVDGEGRGRLAEVAWVVGAPWQGRGIATEAARALVRWLAEQPGRPVHAVVAHIHPAHRASAAVARAAGLVPTEEWHDGERRWHRSVGR